MAEVNETRRRGQNLFGTHACRLSRGVPTPPRFCLAPPPHVFLRSLSCGPSVTRVSPPSQYGPTQRPTCLDDPSGPQICLRTPPCSLMGGDKEIYRQSNDFRDRILISDTKKDVDKAYFGRRDFDGLHLQMERMISWTFLDGF